MDKILKLSLIICVLGMMLTGCNDLREIDRMTFPFVLGIDWDDTSNNIHIYAQISSKPDTLTQEGPIQKEFTVIEGEGKTLKEAMFNLMDYSQQYFSWKQLIAIVFTDRIAKRGIDRELGSLSRSIEIYLNNYLMVTDEDLKELLGTPVTVKTGLPTTVVGINLVSKQGLSTASVTLKDFLIATFNEQKAPIMPQLRIHKRVKKQDENTITLDYMGIGVFSDNRLVGWLDKEETGAYHIISGIQSQGSFAIPASSDSKEADIIISELTTQTKYKPYLQDNKPSMTLEINVQYDVSAYLSRKEIDMEEVEKINSKVESYIKDLVKAVIHRTQSLNADIFGFGGKIYRKYPDYWKENRARWPQLFSDMGVNVEVNAEVRDTGALSGSFEQ